MRNEIMYYLKTIEDKIRVPPNLFGSDIEDAVLNILREKFERRIFKDIGLILIVDNPKIVSEGIVIPGDSGAYYKVNFDATTFMPYVNEVYEADIKEIVEFGAFASVGPLQGLLHVSQISRDKFFYDKKGKHLISREEKKTLKKGDKVLVKVSTVSLKGTTAETKIGLTMRPDGLGKTEWLEEKEKRAKKLAEKAVEKKTEKKEDKK
ncbi:DNA-directed RNA polymerase [Candidatus Micrarchaeota archaeon]|nr:DNA-directed RNA polymerase [Candidatus Micrarchaeota archaeon]